MHPDMIVVVCVAMSAWMKGKHEKKEHVMWLLLLSLFLCSLFADTIYFACLIWKWLVINQVVVISL